MAMAMAMASKENKSFSVLMLPWLAHGHISPFLELAKKLTQRNFQVYFCSTPINLSSIKQSDQISSTTTTTSSSIQLVELHLPSLTNLPPHYHTTKSLPPHLMPTLKTAFDMAGPSFSNLLTTLKPNLVIYDFIPPWAPSIASRQNIPAVQFSSTAAAFASFFYHIFKNNGQFPFPSIYLTDHEQLKVSQMTQYSSKGLVDEDSAFRCTELSTDIVLVKTFREIEAKYIDYLSYMAKKEVIPVGPLVLEEPINDIDYYNDKFIVWLESKEKSSVVFVSFGTEFFMPKEEIEEMAYGLELSKVNFIWVIRFHEGEEKISSLHEVLPQGFMERIGDKGMVVEGWAPQGKILRHPSIGGFVSHCGWNSVLESMKYGVPIVAIPMQLDQPMNARLVVELGLGIEVKKSGDGKLERGEVAKVIKEMVMEKEGEEVKRKSKEMSEKIKDKGEEEIDVVVEKLVHLCERKKTTSN